MDGHSNAAPLDCSARMELQRARQLKRQEGLLRALTTAERPFFKCNMCAFATFGIAKRPNALCPICQSLERSRRTVHVLNRMKRLHKDASILELAPTEGSYCSLAHTVMDGTIG